MNQNFNKYFRYSAMLILSIAFFSCKDYEKIKQLNLKLTTINNRIELAKTKISQEKHTIDSLLTEKNNESNCIKLIDNKVGTYVMDSPMAAAYIYSFDKEPLEILRQYKNLKSEEEFNELLFSHVVLYIYADDNENKIKIGKLRSQFEILDKEKKYHNNIVAKLQRDIDKSQDDIAKMNELIISLIKNAKFIKAEIEKEEN